MGLRLGHARLLFQTPSSDIIISSGKERIVGFFIEEIPGKKIPSTCEEGFLGETFQQLKVPGELEDHRLKFPEKVTESTNREKERERGKVGYFDFGKQLMGMQILK